MSSNELQELKAFIESMQFEIEDMQVQRLVLQGKCELLTMQKIKLERVVDNIEIQEKAK